MKALITIEVDVSESIYSTIKRGTFKVDKDGSGHKLLVGNDVIVTSRECAVHFENNEGKSSYGDSKVKCAS